MENEIVTFISITFRVFYLLSPFDSAWYPEIVGKRELRCGGGLSMVNNTFILMMAMARRMLYLSIVVSSPSSDRTSVIPRYPRLGIPKLIYVVLLLCL